MEVNKDLVTWRSDGIQFPDGVPFRAKYKGSIYDAVVKNGALVLNNRSFSSLSAAAFSITQKPHLDGRCFWECRFSPHSGWESLINIINRRLSFEN